jgi:putative hemolysin
MRNFLLVVVMVGGILLAACGAEPTPTPQEDLFESPLELANPASKYCVDLGNKLEMREETGGTAGYCIFPDGSECEEWAFYRGECQPASSP